MATINILIPSVRRKTFSGGLLTVFEYANGLTRLGHEVRVISLAFGQHPEWYEPSFKIILPKRRLDIISLLSSLYKKDYAGIRRNISLLMMPFSHWSTYSYQRARDLEIAREIIPPSDITFSTAYETALPNFLYGTGQRFYFAQHFEPFFCQEKENEILAQFDALSSYHLPGLKLIANSTWLSNKIGKIVQRPVPVCLNAIDHDIYHAEGLRPLNRGKFIILSYGGRNAKWKGILDAAQAVKIAKEKYSNIEWRVFGKSLLSPDNAYAPYTPLGFLTGHDLRKAYSSADMLLCTAWYESFPLYPLEAMACGTPVVSTPFGVEDYLVHGRNGYMIKPRDPESAAQAIIELYLNKELRVNLAQKAIIDAKQFTWERSVKQLADIIGPF
jgi:glycosyltransferase involved in cell wall biosynthesis